ncbi:MAG TPA: hypothetical protein PKY13_15415 [Microthrixaceae bacterium]|jgi:hypothetical protein|nr:hypothetical protein [Microthrixaceae bacterium]HQF94971.1 hypothetical protein [Microthrixaceae bacterium]
MTAQLTLIDTADTHSWKIPEATRQIGRKGLAEARAILHSIPRRDLDGDSGGTDQQHPAAA